jgi:hypothetical protein
MDDILADDNGILTGVVHWECASVWKACDFPDFLSSKPRYKEPDQYEFSLEDYGFLYEEHLQTKLRQYFLDEMRATGTEVN